MSRLDELQASLTEMSSEELMDLVRHIRADRVTRKARKTTKKPARRKKADKVKALLDNLSPEERAALMRKLKA